MEGTMDEDDTDVSLETMEAIRIAETHLVGASIEKRKALALEIGRALIRFQAIALDDAS